MRAGLPALLGLLLAAGCGAAAPPPAARGADAAQRQRNACAAGEEVPGPRGFVGAAGQRMPVPGEPVAEVRVEGRRRLPEAVIRGALRARAGAPFDAGVVVKDTRALQALEVFEEVRAEATWERAGGLTLTYLVAERPLVERVFVEGAPPREGGDFFFPSAGDVYDGAAVKRARAALASRLSREGHLDAAVRAHALRVADAGVDLCLTIEAGPVYRVRRVAFRGNRFLSDAELLQALAGSLPERQRSAVNVEGGLYRADLLDHAQMYAAAAAYDRGLLRWETVAPEVKLEQVSPAEGSVDITFPIQEGPIFRVASIAFSGALAAPRSEYDALVDVRPGEVFSRSKMLALVGRVTALHQKLGRRDLRVDPVTELGEDTIRIDLRVEVNR